MTYLNYEMLTPRIQRTGMPCFVYACAAHAAIINIVRLQTHLSKNARGDDSAVVAMRKKWKYYNYYLGGRSERERDNDSPIVRRLTLHFLSIHF